MKTKTNKYAAAMKRLRKLAAIAMMYMLLTGNALKANNIAVTGLNVVDMGTYYNLTFSISWDNSWYANLIPNNWDAAWVFVKYRDCSTTNWLHANLDPAGNSVGGGVLTVETVTDNKGIFIHRAATGGPGSIAPALVTLRLANPVPAGGPYNFQVFGIEMVKILQEDFLVGDAYSASTFSNNTITAAVQAAGITGAVLGGGASNVPSTYPMGQGAFYCMKYEITQEEYVDFLNTLTYDQQVNHTGIAPNMPATNYAMYNNPTMLERNGIKIKTSGTASTIPAEYACDYANDNIYNQASDGQNIAMNYLGWYDLTAYLDWACLRPMSDLEFEKICRGPMPRLAREFPWGSSTVITGKDATSVAYPGSNNEYSTRAGLGPCTYGGGGGNAPIRVGSFATAVTDRVAASATYYGVMEMAGNVWERVVSVVGTVAGSGTLFQANCGDGTLPATGYQNVATWPVAVASSSGLRGGSYLYDNLLEPNTVCTSDRRYAATVDVTRNSGYGGRGVR